MQEGCQGEAATKEVNHCLRSSLNKALKTFKALLYWWRITATSVLFSTKAAKPLRRTGAPYRSSILREAAGLPLWCLASPAGRTLMRAFVWADILANKLGMLPSTDLTIPTCSASEVNSILLPPRLLMYTYSLSVETEECQVMPALQQKSVYKPLFVRM